MQRPYDPLASASTERTLLEIAEAYETFLPDERIFMAIDSRDSDDDTVLHRAAFRGVIPDVHDLLQMGADIEARGDIGCTPLHYAAMKGHAEVANLLLEAGASLAARNEWGDTPAQTARKGGFEKLANAMPRTAKRARRRL